MFRDNKIAVVIPAYNEELHIENVVNTIPDLVDNIIVVDDKSIDNTLDVLHRIKHKKLTVIESKTNGGVGSARIKGLKKALSMKCDYAINIDGDGQMDPSFFEDLLNPLIDNECDFTKGNRFFNVASFGKMPKYRVLGNIVATFLTKFATGYWSVFDPQNGYTAVKATVLKKMSLDTLAKGYTYENDFLGQLNLVNARIKDIDVPAVYGEETSSIVLGKVVPAFFKNLANIFAKRFWYKYVLRSFSPVAIFVMLGLPLFIFSLIFGTYIVVNAIGPVNEVSAANAILTSLSFTTGFTLLLASLVIDIFQEPK